MEQLMMMELPDADTPLHVVCSQMLVVGTVSGEAGLNLKYLSPSLISNFFLSNLFCFLFVLFCFFSLSFVFPEDTGTRHNLHWLA